MKRSKTTIKDWTRLVDKSDDKIRKMYQDWKREDSTMVGLVRILMIQEIEWSSKQKGPEFYYGQYDEILKTLMEKYNV
jgi:hypothetical protein